MAKISTSNTKSILKDANFGNYLKNVFLDEVELDNGFDDLFDDTWVKSNSKTKVVLGYDGGSSTITGTNLSLNSKKPSGYIKSITDAGKDDGDKWSVKINFSGNGVNVSNPTNFSISKLEFEKKESDEFSSIKFNGNLALKMNSSGSLKSAQMTIKSFTTDWHDKNDKGAVYKSGKMTITSKKGLTIDLKSGKVLSGTIDGYSQQSMSNGVTTKVEQDKALNTTQMNAFKKLMTSKKTDSLAKDFLYGGNDTITGTSTKSNNLDGWKGNDTIKGNKGKDTINGGLGNDKLTGGAGKDTFVFNTTLNAKTNVDKITDFKVVDDTIQLENAIFKKLSKTGVLKKDFFKVVNNKTKATDANDYIIYNKDNGSLSYDADGGKDGFKDAVKFAELQKGLNLKFDDFQVV